MTDASQQDLPALARHLVRAADRATLATALVGHSWPYASLVMAAVDHDGSLLLLLSDLAEHTKNLKADPRVSLLFDGTAGLNDPLTGPRLTLLGRAEVTTEPRHRTRYLARHPAAALFADFGDFRFYRVAITRGHLVGGFGRIRWIEADALSRDVSGSAALIAAEQDIVDHMNQDHADALDLYATALLGLAGTGWTMTGIDPFGIDLRRGGAVARLPFERTITGPEQARAELVALVRSARNR